MSRYDLQQLISMWARERLTAEQAMGQVLLLLENLSQRLGEVERRTDPNYRPASREENPK